MLNAHSAESWFVMCYSFADEQTGSLRNDKSGSYNDISITIPNTGCEDGHTSACFAISAQLESRSTFTVKASWCIHTLLLTMVKAPWKLTFVYIWNMSDTGKYILRTWNALGQKVGWGKEGGGMGGLEGDIFGWSLGLWAVDCPLFQSIMWLCIRGMYRLLCHAKKKS